MIRVHRITTTSATVHYRPHWLLRMLGAKERDYEVKREGWYWIDTTTGRDVPADVDEAIEREIARALCELNRAVKAQGE